MGILGKIELVHRTRDVTIGVSTTGEEITVKVNAPRLQLIPELRTEIPAPTAPPMKDSNGRIRYERDHKTGEPIKKDGQLVPKLDWSSQEFLVRVASVERARTIAMIFECAEFPGTTDLKESDYQDKIEYWLARWGELENAGVDVGAFSALSDACVALGEPMSKGEVEDARHALGTDRETQDAAKAKLGSKTPPGK